MLYLAATTALAFAPSGLRVTPPVSVSRACPVVANADHDIMIRAARGEEVERTPVWLMRQAGRYMADFRAYSEKYPFRMRSETPEIAVELSLQPWRTFGVDGVIMFSDILTPLPALGIDFDVVKGTGPIIGKPLRSMDDVLAMKPLDDIDSELPFLRTILGDLRKETEGKTSLLGFVGSPFTLVAYAVEGSANRHCIHSKKMMARNPEVPPCRASAPTHLSPLAMLTLSCTALPSCTRHPYEIAVEIAADISVEVAVEIVVEIIAEMVPEGSLRRRASVPPRRFCTRLSSACPRRSAATRAIRLNAVLSSFSSSNHGRIISALTSSACTQSRTQTRRAHRLRLKRQDRELQHRDPRPAPLRNATLGSDVGGQLLGVSCWGSFAVHTALPPLFGLHRRWRT